MVASAEQKLGRLADALVEKRGGVALTGAGISVDSGIPDFRSPGGLWERFDPMEYGTIEAFRSDPERVWTMLAELDGLLEAAQPNPGHLALAELERLGVLGGIITQNVDNLHQKAGSERVVEFHGNGSRLRCLSCDHIEGADERRGDELPPRCGCGQVLKPDVVLFGEPIPPDCLQLSAQMIEQCEVMLVVGTSATVVPASLLPMAAQRRGALLVELNVEATELTALCDVAVHANASESLPKLVECVKQRL